MSISRFGVLYTILVCPCCWSQDMLKTTTTAVLATDSGRITRSFLEKDISNKLGTSKNTAATFGAIALSSLSGKISTEQIKNMEYNHLRPDIYHSFNGQETRLMVTFKVGF